MIEVRAVQEGQDKVETWLSSFVSCLRDALKEERSRVESDVSDVRRELEELRVEVVKVQGGWLWGAARWLMMWGGWLLASIVLQGKKEVEADEDDDAEE